MFKKCYIIGEIGINHSGSLEIAKKLIDMANLAGCDAVKFQKRTIDIVYTKEELETSRESVFGKTNGDLKRGLEFGKEQYDEINQYCKEKKIDWFSSCWDKQSVDFMEQYNPKYYKIQSASTTDIELLKYIKSKNRKMILSTGMSDIEIIRKAVDILGEEGLIILHCISTYPAKIENLNLNCIKTLKKEFPKSIIGYSGHEVGLSTSLAAFCLGAQVIERHITLDRAMWGSDQAASVEPNGLIRLVRDIRTIEKAMGDGNIKIYDEERPIMKKLRTFKE